MHTEISKIVFAFSLLLLLTGVAFCDDQAGDAKWKSWIPAGWKLLASATGDLNRDGKNDAVLIFEEDNPKKRSGISIGRYLEREANLNSRRLIVLFQTPSGYRRRVETDRFLPSQNKAGDPCRNRTLEKVRIERGQFQISMHHAYDCGIGSGGDSKFIFRYQSGRLRLIGLESSFATRDIECIQSTNYLTGNQIIISGNPAEDKMKKRQTRIPARKRFVFLDEMKDAHNYDLSEYLSEDFKLKR